MATYGSRQRKCEQFWTFVNRRAVGTPLDGRLGKPTTRHFHRFATGAPKAGFHVSMVLHLDDHDAECQLVIEAADPVNAFERLKAQQTEIDAEVGSKLDWEGQSERTERGSKGEPRCLITQHRRWADVEDLTERRKAADWLLERAQAFDAVFTPRIRALGALSAK